MATFTPSGQTQLLRLWLPRSHRQARRSWCWPHSCPRPREAPQAAFSPARSLEGASNLASFPSPFRFLLLLPAGGQLPDLPSFHVGLGVESSPLLCRCLGVLDQEGCTPAGLMAAGATAEPLHLWACVQRLLPEVLTGPLWRPRPPLSGAPPAWAQESAGDPGLSDPPPLSRRPPGTRCGGRKRLPWLTVRFGIRQS